MRCNCSMIKYLLIYISSPQGNSAFVDFLCQMSSFYEHHMHTSFPFLLKIALFVERIPPKGFVIQKWQYFDKTNGVTKSVSALS